MGLPYSESDVRDADWNDGANVYTGATQVGNVEVACGVGLWEVTCDVNFRAKASTTGGTAAGAGRTWAGGYRLIRVTTGQVIIINAAAVGEYNVQRPDRG